MSFALWSPSYETGHSEVDHQHQRLFQMINELHEAMSRGRGREALGPVLTGLVAYTVEHFAAEETLMRASSYPDIERHLEKHQALARQVSELALRFSKGYLTIPNTLAQFLSTWLKHHIREEDMALIQWVNNRPERW